MGVVYIYGLIDPRNDEVFYVGYTKNLKTRYNSHLNIDGHGRVKNLYKNNVIRKILKVGLKPEMKIIDECKHEFNNELNMFEHERLEIYYIKKYREGGIKLTNLTDGGGDTGAQLKKRVFKYDQFGNYIGEYESIADAGIEHNINSTNIGHAVDQRIKNTCCNYYWFSSKEKANVFEFKISMRNNLSILQYSLNGNFIREFKNKREVENSLKMGRGLLCRVLQTNGLKSSGGYLWFYKGNVPEKIIKHTILHTKKISQYDLDGNFIESYDSIKEASKITNISDVNIISCAKGKYSRAGNYMWRYGNNLFGKIAAQKPKHYGIPILKYDLNNKLICEYASITEAVKENELTWGIIKSHLNNGKKTKNNFVWKYKNNLN
jgi:hypothetical protein